MNQGRWHVLLQGEIKREWETFTGLIVLCKGFPAFFFSSCLP